MIKQCQECRVDFDTGRGGNRRKFCSVDCYSQKRKRQPCGFKSQHIPWNKGIKGLQHSPATQFTKGQKGIHWVPVGTVRIRTHKKDKQRAWQKIAEPNVWKLRAVVVWESHNGALPVGKLIHHHDRDPLNDEITNLQALTRAEHMAEHRSEFRKRRTKKEINAHCQDTQQAVY